MGARCRGQMFQGISDEHNFEMADCVRPDEGGCVWVRSTLQMRELRLPNGRGSLPGRGRPSTHLDWAHAARHVRILAKAYPPDLSRMITVGRLGTGAQSVTRRHGDVRLRDYKCPDH